MVGRTLFVRTKSSCSLNSLSCEQVAPHSRPCLSEVYPFAALLSAAAFTFSAPYCLFADIGSATTESLAEGGVVFELRKAIVSKGEVGG
jgi:hypothetical protein